MMRVLIDRFLLAVSQNGGVLTEDIALQIEQAFRKEYCGARCEVYAHSRSLLTKKKTDVISAHSAGQSVEDISRSQRLSRATIYRYMKK